LQHPHRQRPHNSSLHSAADLNIGHCCCFNVSRGRTPPVEKGTCYNCLRRLDTDPNDLTRPRGRPRVVTRRLLRRGQDGVTISFGMLDFVKIAHPGFIMLGSFVAYIVNSNFGIAPILIGVVTSWCFS